jgi:hypothetical protein
MEKESILTWFKQQQQKSTLKAEIIPIQESADWAIRQDGTISYEDKIYYEGIIGKYWKEDKKKGKNIKKYENLLIRSTSKDFTRGKQIHGVILLAKYKNKYLVQAKAEIGNITSGRIVLTTTIQSCHENLRKYPIPYRELIQEKVRFTLAAPQDAGMLYGKYNEYIFVVLKEEPIIEENFYLATLQELAELQEQDLLGEHITQMLGHIMIWESKNEVEQNGMEK